jgi:hypothetical protein
MTEQKRKPNEPHDQFIKQFVPVVLKNLFESQTSVSVQLSEELAIDVLCMAINRDRQVAIDDSLGLLGRLVAIHPTIIRPLA